MITILTAVFVGIPNLVSLIVVLWIAGGLPVEQNKLKDAFYKRAHCRYLIALSPEELHFKREILDKENKLISHDFLILRLSRFIRVEIETDWHTLLNQPINRPINMPKQNVTKKLDTAMPASSFYNSPIGLRVQKSPHSSFSIPISNSHTMESNLSRLLLAFLLMIGIIPEFSKTLLFRKAYLVIYFLLLFQIVDVLAMNITSFQNRTILKNLAAYVFSLSCNLMALHTLRWKKNNLLNVLRMFEKLSSDTHNRRTNIMVLIIFSVSFIYSVTITLDSNIKRVSAYYAYGHELKSHMLQFSVSCIKAFFLFLAHTTFPSLVVVLFCSLCLHCSSCFNCLTRKVLRYSPEGFGPSEQMDILRQKAKIDSILEKLQDIFSLPSFFVILSNLFTCCSVLGMVAIGFQSESVKIIKAFFYGIFHLISLVFVLWVAGGLPLEQNKLKNAFYKRAHSRFLIALSSEESQCKREILDKPNFVFSGCNIFSYTRNSVLTLVGTLLTYALIIYQI
ncbi:uncharacterized protein TNIN_213441 [Trichonephila inaurata madagascariensis]|uniref:Gustatory receptor n=1 Tax=Trichonephila inaurata madagascariensis TaxID=2747483 RepID=A0A8X6YT53_9ARAC|nr:uncharacterized protein TNIN_213441 [Trichonephila inaurata madagascariensis]